RFAVAAALRGHPAHRVLGSPGLTPGDDGGWGGVSRVHRLLQRRRGQQKALRATRPGGLLQRIGTDPSRQASAARTLSAMALNAAGSDPAMSASTLRSISIPASARP